MILYIEELHKIVDIAELAKQVPSKVKKVSLVGLARPTNANIVGYFICNLLYCAYINMSGKHINMSGKHINVGYIN